MEVTDVFIQNPDSLVQAEVSVAGADYDPCSLVAGGGGTFNGTGTNGQTGATCAGGMELAR